jgi:hypothetical protein
MGAVLTAWLLCGVNEDLAEATRLLKAAQEEAAVQVLTRSLDRPALPSPDRARLYVLLGIARVNLRDEEGALLAFQRGVEASSTVELPPRIAPPRARELFEQAKAEVARRRALPPVPEPRPERRDELAPPVTVAPAAAVEQQKPASSTTRWVGLALGLVGVGAGGTGAYFLVNGTSLRSQSVTEPVATNAAQLFGRAQSSWTAGLALVTIGAVLLVAGVITALL